MKADNQRIIRRILRVNHSGEHGAVAIYSSQLRRARKHFPEITPWLEKTLGHELRHRDEFLSAMPSRGAKTCRAMYVWHFGGAALGFISALFDRTGVMVCTTAVERTVHRHLVEQIHFLENSDGELAAIVKNILKEEDAHLAIAEKQHDPTRASAKILAAIISAATEVLIFMSTRGDSRKLNVWLKNA